MKLGTQKAFEADVRTTSITAGMTPKLDEGAGLITQDITTSLSVVRIICN